MPNPENQIAKLVQSYQDIIPLLLPDRALTPQQIRKILDEETAAKKATAEELFDLAQKYAASIHGSLRQSLSISENFLWGESRLLFTRLHPKVVTSFRLADQSEHYWAISMSYDSAKPKVADNQPQLFCQDAVFYLVPGSQLSYMRNRCFYLKTYSADPSDMLVCHPPKLTGITIGLYFNPQHQLTDIGFRNHFEFNLYHLEPDNFAVWPMSSYEDPDTEDYYHWCCNDQHQYRYCNDKTFKREPVKATSSSITEEVQKVLSWLPFVPFSLTGNQIVTENANT